MHYQRWCKYGDADIDLSPRIAPGEPLRYLLAHMRDGCCDCNPWPYATSEGYPRVTDEDGCRRKGHRVVCEIVNGPPPFPGAVARHLCGRGHLGCFNADCLVWGSRVDDKQDSIGHETWAHGESNGRSKLRDADIPEILQWLGDGMTQTEAARRKGVSLSTISHIINKRKWQHIQ